jgi:hypothetical protein
VAAERLSLRALNRATLARQLLLARKRNAVPKVIEQLAGLQAQLARPPFIGLWSRIDGFERKALLRLLERRDVVRATMMRGTIHLVTARDYLAFRRTIQPALNAGIQSIVKARAPGVEPGPLVAIGEASFARGPQTFESFRADLERRKLKGDLRVFAGIVRMHVPLVQTPVEHPWGFTANSEFALASAWLGKAIPAGSGVDALALRYLGAFGPATASDFQTWSALPGPICRAAFEALAPKLSAFQDERGRPIFDLPRAPRPDADSAVPVRFLPEYDNLLLAHSDRRRFVPDAHKAKVFLPGLRITSAFLVDGFVAGAWWVERKRATATLMLEGFEPIAKAAKAALEKEGVKLARFVEPDADDFEVRWSGPRAGR